MLTLLSDLLVVLSKVAIIGLVTVIVFCAIGILIVERCDR